MPGPQRPRGELGCVAWRYPSAVPGQDATWGALRNCIAIDGSGRIIAALGERVFALVEEEWGLTGAWTYDAGGSIPGSPVIGADQRIRVHAADGCLHAISAEGNAAWTPVPIGEPLGWATPLIDERNNCWISAYRGGLLRVDPSGAALREPFLRSRQRFDSTGLVRDGVCYIGGEDGLVRAIVLGEPRGRSAWPATDATGRTEWFINTALVPGAGGVIIVAGRDEHIYGFDMTGQLAWRLHVRGQMLGTPVVSPTGDIYVGVSLLERGRPPRGMLTCVAADGRRVRWEYAADGPIESTPVVGSDGVIYFGDNAGFAHAVGAGGRLVWKEPVGSAIRSAGAMSARGRIVFGLDDGSIIGLQCGSSGLAASGWPKFLGDAANSGRTAAPAGPGQVAANPG